MKLDITILGASGYGGGELLRLLSGHPAVGRLRGSSRRHAGKAWHDVHPNLRGVLDGVFEEAVEWESLGAAGQPVVFSAMPHGALAARMVSLEQEWANLHIADRVRVLDLSGDFRLRSGDDYAAAYGTEHPCPQLLASFEYGLPEWTRAELRGARRIACAGCFATALQIGLLPLRGLNLGLVAATGVTGSSGSGAAPGDGTHHPTRAHDFRAYKALRHQHLAEVLVTMGRAGIGGDMSFVPQSSPLVRGIFVTLQFLLPPGLDAAGLAGRARCAAENEPFLRLVPGSPRVSSVVGSNFADVAVDATPHGHAAVLVAIDNLVKGMAGQAIQCMNLAVGLPEITGLRFAGAYPA